MKLFIKLILFVVVAAVAAPFFITGPAGKPMLMLNRIKAPDAHLPDFKKAVDSVKESLSDEGDEQSGRRMEVFRWKDEKGVWHYSDTKEQGRPAQIVTLNPNTSVVHLEPGKSAASKNGTAAEKNKADGSSSFPIVPSLSMGTLPELITDAKNVAQVQRQRTIRQERAMQEE
jgi:hypothetical protein